MTTYILNRDYGHPTRVTVPEGTIVETYEAGDRGQQHVNFYERNKDEEYGPRLVLTSFSGIDNMRVESESVKVETWEYVENEEVEKGHADACEIRPQGEHTWVDAASKKPFASGDTPQVGSTL